MWNVGISVLIIILLSLYKDGMTKHYLYKKIKVKYYLKHYDDDKYLKQCWNNKYFSLFIKTHFINVFCDCEWIIFSLYFINVNKLLLVWYGTIFCMSQ